MKIKYQDSLIIVYLYKRILSYNQKDLLHQEIKDLFIKLIKNYQLDLFGYFKVDIYENKKYGCVLEINKIYGDNTEFIDLKIILHHNTTFYLVMDDIYLFEFNNMKYQNKRWYLNIEKIDNINNIIEFGDVYYDK